MTAMSLSYRLFCVTEQIEKFSPCKVSGFYLNQLFIQGDRLGSRGTRGVDFDEFILYNVNMVNVTFLPKLDGKRTFELELALKTRSEEVTFTFS